MIGRERRENVLEVQMDVRGKPGAGRVLCSGDVEAVDTSGLREGARDVGGPNAFFFFEMGQFMMAGRAFQVDFGRDTMEDRREREREREMRTRCRYPRLRFEDLGSVWWE